MKRCAQCGGAIPNPVRQPWEPERCAACGDYGGPPIRYGSWVKHPPTGFVGHVVEYNPAGGLPRVLVRSPDGDTERRFMAEEVVTTAPQRKRPPPHERGPKPAPSMMPGYAYELEARTPDYAMRRWRRAPDDDWQIVVVDAAEVVGAEYLGKRTIDGTRCRVFRAIPGAIYAQTAAATGGDY